jgi:lipopolysaccharide/colanic/teichoic acid biosynthesis glycosyltransferase
MLTLILAEAHSRCWSIARRNRTTTCRIAVFAGAALMLGGWSWLHGFQHVTPALTATVLLGSFLGGVTATTLDTGFVEDNAPPSDAVREKVLAFHRDVDLRYPRERWDKRLFDVTTAVVGILVTLPFWLVIAALIWLEEPGPVFFTKNSVGKAGVTFRQLKFRSMRHDAETLTGPIASCPDDPRTLLVGKWLRRWHLDELPELINVLCGQMSIVGPRPLRTVLVLDHLERVPGYAERHTVKPGIACIAQIEAYRMSPHERLRKDRAYIRRMSMGTDITLLYRAVATTLRGQRDRNEAARSMS